MTHTFYFQEFQLYTAMVPPREYCYFLKRHRRSIICVQRLKITHRAYRLSSQARRHFSLPSDGADIFQRPTRSCWHFRAARCRKDASASHISVAQGRSLIHAAMPRGFLKKFLGDDFLVAACLSPSISRRRARRMART